MKRFNRKISVIIRRKIGYVSALFMTILLTGVTVYAGI